MHIMREQAMHVGRRIGFISAECFYKPRIQLYIVSVRS